MASKPIALALGSYEARSLTAEAQRCVNLYPEKNPEDAVFPFTLYPVPGLVTLAGPDTPSPGRGLYLASNGTLFACAGNLIYTVDPTDWSLTAVGELQTNSGIVGMKDNNTDFLLADGSGKCYTCTLEHRVITPVSDPNCLGSTGVDLIDGFFLLNQPKTRVWYTSLDNVVEFDNTFVAAKSGSNDLLQRVVAVHREAWLLGTATSEVWYDAGNPDGISFGLIPGAFIQHGTPAPQSPAVWDSAIFFLAQSPQGTAYVMQGMNYAAKPISTPAISEILSRYSVLEDAIGFCYEQSGHAFYCLTFPHADATWVYDISQGLWHQRAWFDADGRAHRFRPCCIISAFGKVIGQDWQNGALYELVEGAFTDTKTETPGTFIYPYPPIPPALPDNEILELYNPVASNGLTAENCLVDWDAEQVYVCLGRDVGTVNDGIYLSNLRTGALIASRLAGYFQEASFDGPMAISPSSLYCASHPISNITKLFRIDRGSLSLRHSFGELGASYDFPESQAPYPVYGISVITFNEHDFIFTGSVYNAANKLLTSGPDGRIGFIQDFGLPLTNSYPFAGKNDGKDSATVFYFNTDHAGPYTNPIKLYKWEILPGAEDLEVAKRTLTHVLDITPAMIDPAWTEFFGGLRDYGYDATDGSVLGNVNGRVGTGTSKNYLFKVNVETGVIAWTIEVGVGGVAGRSYLRDCRINYGCLVFFFDLTHFYIIDTVLGTIVDTFTYLGLTADYIKHDDTTGQLVGTGGYSGSGGGNNIVPIPPTPNGFGGFSPGSTGFWFRLDWSNNWAYGGAHLEPGTGTSTPRGSFPVPGALLPNQMTFIRSFQHIVAGGTRMLLNSFMLKVDGGRTSATEQAEEPEVTGQTISLRYSADGAQSWGEALAVTLGETGEFFTSPIWRQLGIAAGRDYVFEVSWSGGGIRALLGAWLDAEALEM